MTTDTAARPPIVDAHTWRRQLDALRIREKAATRELDAIAAQRRRLPMVALPDYTLEGEDGPVRLIDVFDGQRQLITYHHMWSPGRRVAVRWLYRLHRPVHPTGLPAALRRPVRDRHPGPDRRGPGVQGEGRQPDDLVLHGRKSFGGRCGCPARWRVRDQRVPSRRGQMSTGPGTATAAATEQLSHTFPLIDLLPCGRQEPWQDSPAGWPQSETYEGWLDSPDIARLYGPGSRS